MELEQEVIFDKNEEMAGKELYAFIEGKVADENAYVGRTYMDAAGCGRIYFHQYFRRAYDRRFCKGEGNRRL